ncbi:MAG: fimbrillin family protein, partial [Muribaculaceae bacterium]|nr:fimbrillin family protein [Muribaculaceae bacterium]
MNRIARTSYIIFGCAMLLSSCSQEDTPTGRHEGNDSSIIFHTSLPEMTTRAKEIATDLPYFHMTAFDETDSNLIKGDTLEGYFYNKKIEKIAEGSNQYKSEECMWPEQGHESDTLHFFAYYPELNDGAKLVNATVGSTKTTGYKIDGFKVDSLIANQVDFVTAYTTGNMDDNYFSGINLK